MGFVKEGWVYGIEEFCSQQERVWELDNTEEVWRVCDDGIKKVRLVISVKGLIL